MYIIYAFCIPLTCFSHECIKCKRERHTHTHRRRGVYIDEFSMRVCLYTQKKVSLPYFTVIYISLNYKNSDLFALSRCGCGRALVCAGEYIFSTFASGFLVGQKRDRGACALHPQEIRFLGFFGSLSLTLFVRPARLTHTGDI